jgi:hypothetical protein
VKPGRGISISDSAEFLENQGFEPHEIDMSSVPCSPDELDIIQRGRYPEHFEIVPAETASLTLAEYTSLLQRIRVLG